MVAKFYRPSRWTAEQILEEHEFTLELANSGIPAVAPELRQCKSLHFFEGFRFALFNLKVGRAPELDSKKDLEVLGRTLGRVHAIGSSSLFT